MKRSLIVFLPVLLIGVFISYSIGFKQALKTNEESGKQTQEVELNKDVNKEVDNGDENKFPPLDMPLEYFDAKDARSPRYIQKDYDFIMDTPSYRSYPTTIISLSPEMYSSIPTALPPIKSDSEIDNGNPGFMGATKLDNVAKYGNLARRFVGDSDNADIIGGVSYADVDKDGSKETLLSLYTLGANILGQWDIVIKEDQVIFSTNAGSFSILTPAENGNGFFLQWIDDLMSRDGYTTTRFVFDGEKFIPVYEQQTKYVRIKNN